MTHFYDRDTAAHEVGHGLVARELGATNVRSFMREADGLGACHFRMPPTRDEFEALLDELVISGAGSAAEQLVAGVDPLGAGFAGEIALRALSIEKEPPPNAYEHALGVLERMFGDRGHAVAALSRCSDQVLIRAVEILRERLPELERLAARLRSEGEIRL